MDLRLERKQSENCTVSAITSKSYVHRLLIAAALGRDRISIRSNIYSKDMEATVRVINALGGSISASGTGDGEYLFTVERTLIEAADTGRCGACTDEVVLDCGESGSTARFILPVATLIADRVTVTGSGKLPGRPMGPLCNVLRDAGVSVSSDHLPITLSGRPHAGSYSIAGNVSSQFISGLLFMLPLLDGVSSLSIEGELESAPYVDMTVDVLEKFGVDYDISKDGDLHGGISYVNHGGSQYIYTGRRDKAETAESDIVIAAEGDWSNAAYIMAIAAAGAGRSFDGVTVRGLCPDSRQGDREIISVLEKFGVSVIERDNEGAAEYIVHGNPYRCVDVQCRDIPDLVPALAVIAAYTDGDSIFRNVERLRLKECDRIEAVVSMLAKVGVLVDITYERDHENMIVHGKGMLDPVSDDIVIDSRNDHRIAMCAAAIAFAENAPVVIKDAMAVNKSYPGFYDVIDKLGMNCTAVPETPK